MVGGLGSHSRSLGSVATDTSCVRRTRVGGALLHFKAACRWGSAPVGEAASGGASAAERRAATVGCPPCQEEEEHREGEAEEAAAACGSVRGAGRRGDYGRRCCGRIRQLWEILRDPSPLRRFFSWEKILWSERCKEYVWRAQPGSIGTRAKVCDSTKFYTQTAWG